MFHKSLYLSRIAPLALISALVAAGAMAEIIVLAAAHGRMEEDLKTHLGKGTRD
jgi:hypothetical protein